MRCRRRRRTASLASRTLLSSVQQAVLAIAPTCYAQYYTISTGTCPTPVTTSTACAAAGAALGISTHPSGIDDGQNGATWDPPLCYVENNFLKFNSGNNNVGEFHIPNVLEVLYVRNDLVAKHGCVSSADPHLDKPNNPSAPEIAPPNLPVFRITKEIS